MNHRRSFAAVLSLAVAVGLGSASSAVYAAGPPELRATIETDVIGVGDELHLQLQASSSEEMPSAPELTVPKALTLRGPSVSSSTRMTITNGSRSDQLILTATWAISATKPGVYTIGPASVMVRGKRYAGKVTNIRVLPAGQARKPQQQRAPQVFDLFGNPIAGSDPFQALFGQLDTAPPPEAREPEAEPKLALDRAPSPGYFLHAIAEKREAVIGEPVVVSTYEYIDPQAVGSDVAIRDYHEAEVDDFIKRSLLEDDQQGKYQWVAMVGGRKWLVRIRRRWALFPLKAGELTVGPMMEVVDAPPSLRKAKREAEALRIHVTEPPIAGRPPGYSIGDVGRFSLTAEVSPREAEEDGVVAVTAVLEGTGNVPSRLRPPTRASAEWLEPEMKEKIVSEAFNVHAKRTFSFVVRLHQAGDIDLGEMQVPFWDPEAHRYEVARVALGTVHVKRAAVGASKSQPVAARDVLAGLPAPRDIRAFSSAPRTYLSDSPEFWLLGVFGPPLGFLSAFGLTKGVGRLRARLRARRDSPQARLEARLEAADAAARGTDPRLLDAELTRAVEEAAVVKLGVVLRGARADEVRPKLLAAKVPESVADALSSVLRESEAARFSPEAPRMEEVRGRWGRARSALRDIEVSS